MQYLPSPADMEIPRLVLPGEGGRVSGGIYMPSTNAPYGPLHLLHPDQGVSRPESPLLPPHDLNPTMPGHPLCTVFRLTAIAAAALLLAGIATLGYLFSEEDYVTRPGSPVYYLGISSLVRDIQVPDGAQSREYFGSVGDGNKPAQSQLSFKVQPEAADAVWDQMTQQLQKLALHSVSTAGNESTAVVSNKNTVSPGIREAQYTSEKHDLILLTTYQDNDAGTPSIRFEITHFD